MEKENNRKRFFKESSHSNFVLNLFLETTYIFQLLDCISYERLKKTNNTKILIYVAFKSENKVYFCVISNLHSL